MTKNEKFEFIKLRSKLVSIKSELQSGMRDFDCKWPYDALTLANEALDLMSKFKL